MRRMLIAMGLVLLSVSPGWAQLTADTYIAGGLNNPIGFVQDPVNDNVQFVIEQTGRIRVIQSGVLLAAPFLNLSGSISCCGERGLLGLAFPPDTAASGRFYVNFTNAAGHTVIARFTRLANPLVADAMSRFDLRWGSPTGPGFIFQDFANHNGGSLNFGSDGYLYIGMGDGGSGNDPNRRAQDPQQLLGKMLRIDVNVLDSDPQGYVVPADNPFVGAPPTKPEIWAFGLRNPWKFTFDDGPGGTNAMLIGDVGQGAWEEVDYEPAGAGGRNYGWVVREGAHDTGIAGNPGAPLPYTDPIVEYSHSTGFSITGGYVYRGARLPGFDGRYFFADFSRGRVWSVALNVDPMTGEATAADLREHTSELGGAALGTISSFGRDSRGDLYLVRYAGSIFRIRSTAPVTGVTLTPDRTAPQATGTTIMWTATPTGGVAPYQYKWWIYDGVKWTMAGPWTSANTFAWTPTLPHANYHVAVWVKSDGNPADVPDAVPSVHFPISGPAAPGVSAVTLNADRSAPQAPGTTITWTALPSGGGTPHQYKWWIYDGTSWTPTAWTHSNTFMWTPTQPNPNYHVAVWVKNASNSADSPEAVKVAPFAINFPPVSSVTLTADRSAPQAPGTTITWTAIPSGGGAPYQYKYWIYDGMSWTPTAWTGSNTFMWTPSMPNANYHVAVWVKSAGNAADSPEAVQVVPFAINYANVTSVTLTPDRSAPQAPGTTITWTATPSGGGPPHQYKWWIYDGASWTPGAWTSSNTFMWTPTVPSANYQVGVWVKSAGNAADAPEAARAVPFAIGGTP